MDRVLCPVVASKIRSQDATDPTIAYQQLSMKIKELLKEASQAKEKGQWKKAQDLLFEARIICRDFHLNR